jgi:hypothetical protein
MSCKQLLAGVVNSLLPLLVFSAMACAQQSHFLGTVVCLNIRLRINGVRSGKQDGD